MTNLAVLNREGESVGEIELNENIFSAPINVPVMHQAIRLHLASRRKGAHSVKTRAEVSGGGKKPWRQKGTGRARAGSSRSPIWRGGGVTFGPSVRSHAFSMPKKMRRLALLSALSLKVREEKLIVVEELDFALPKTKEMQRVLKNVDALNALIIFEEGNGNGLLSAANLPTVSAAGVKGLNTYSILLHDKLIITKEALSSLEEVLT